MEFLSVSVSSDFQRLLDEYAHENELPVISEEIRKQLGCYIMEFSDEDLEIKLLCLKIASPTGDDWVIKVYRQGCFEGFMRSMDKVLALGDGRMVEAEIEVPGLLFASNAHQVESNVVKWKFQDNVFQYKDYTLEVQYRTINLWVVMLSIIIMLVILWLIFVKK